MKGLEATWHIDGNESNATDVLIVSEPITPISYHHSTESDVLDQRIDTETYVIVLPLQNGVYPPQAAALDHLHIQMVPDADTTRREMGLIE